MKGRTVVLRCVVMLVVIFMLVGISASAAAAQDDPGAVYVLTNQTANSILVFARAADGKLSFSGKFATGGEGAGTGVDPPGLTEFPSAREWPSAAFCCQPWEQ